MPSEVTIIAGGWSASEVDLDRARGTVIGVNDAGLLAPRCDIVVSMDRLWSEHRWEQLRKLGRPAWLRRSALQNLDARWPWCHVFDCDHTSVVLDERPDWLNGTNSGLCGFNLGFQLLRRGVGGVIYLVGFDMRRGPNGEAHWFPPYSWSPQGATKPGKFAAWATQFRAARAACEKAGIVVFNVSSSSAIETFPRLTPEQFAELASCGL